MPLLQLTDITKIYYSEFLRIPIPGVEHLSFSLNTPGITGFIGPNGAGKTTTIKLILGLIQPTSGTIKINNIPATEPSARKSIAYVSEQPYFYDYLTAEEVLQFLGTLKGLSAEAIKQDVPRILEKLSLTEHAKKKVRSLSKGNQQRLNFAQALLGNPSIFILDEPMSGLDPIGRSLFRSIFRDLAEQGKTIFFSTHILEDIETLCSRIIVMSKGKQTYDGTVDSLLESGSTGMDITVSSINNDALSYLKSLDCQVTQPFPNMWSIFVPKSTDSQAIQRWLSERGIFCTAITRRTKSLESLLYDQKKSGTAS